MTGLLVVLLILTLVWAVLENYWRRHHAERERAWRVIAASSLKNAGEMRETLRRQARKSRVSS